MTKDRGPRTFVLICTIAIAAVIAYPLIFGRDGFLKTFPKMLSATPAPPREALLAALSTQGHHLLCSG